MSPEINIREANIEDRMTLWQWYHEPLRRIVFPSQHQKDRDVHKKWWSQIAIDPDITMLIGLADIIRIGCVRFDRRKGDIVDMRPYLKPAYHRQGILPGFLDAAMAAYAESAQVAAFRLQVESENPRLADVLPANARITKDEDSLLTQFHWPAPE